MGVDMDAKVDSGATRLRPWLYVAWALPVAVLLGAACYELFLALELVPLPQQAGPASSVEWSVLMAGLAASCLGAVMCWLAAAVPQARVRVLTYLAAPAGAAFMVTRFYTFDPYYGMAVRRMSQGGAIHPAWVFILVALSLLTVLVIRKRSTLGLGAAGVVLLLCGLTALFAGTGH